VADRHLQRAETDRRGCDGMTPTVETVLVPHCDFEAKVKIAGSGPPVVYLHPAGGPAWDPFLDALAEHHTVYAPDHPGTGDTARDAIHRVPGLWDLVLVYDELLDALSLERVPLVGASFGGMVACEVAAHRRRAISALVLLDSIGLWRDDAPVAQYMTMTPDELASTLFHDPLGPAAREAMALPSEPDELAVAMADLTWALGATGKFVWPIPDKGLARRLHRVTAPTLLIWGQEDKLVSPVYAQEFADRLDNARVELIPDAGHVPQLERLDVVAPLVLDFLAGR
jgi:pimeloyl-ACP methyl ester carboxylesterase